MLSALNHYWSYFVAAAIKKQAPVLAIKLLAIELPTKKLTTSSTNREYATKLTGVDATQEEITTFQKVILQSKDGERSKSFFLKDATRCRKLEAKNHAIDPQTGQLFDAICDDDKSIEKENPVQH